MWYESVGKRRCSEIGSCLMRFINHYVHQDTKWFSFCSDNCTGQNRNKFSFTMYNCLAQKHNIVIRHAFLEKGHKSKGTQCKLLLGDHPSMFHYLSLISGIPLCERQRKINLRMLLKSTKNFFDLKLLTQETTLNCVGHEKNE